MEKSSKLKALVIGATGASGREVVKSLMNSDKWSNVSVVVRRTIPEWDKYNSTEKFKAFIVQDLKELIEFEKWEVFKNFDSVFSCLGCRSNDKHENIYRIEYTYAYNAGLLAKKYEIPHFSYIGGEGLKKGSWLYHADVKGRVVEDLKKLDFPIFSLFNPGFLIDRENDDRFFDKVYKYIPFVPKIKTSDLGLAMVREAERINSSIDRSKKEIFTYKNSLIKELLK